MNKRVLSFIFIFILSVSLCIVPNKVYASQTSKTGDSTDAEKAASDSKDASAGGDSILTGMGLDDVSIKRIKGWVLVLQQDGYSTAAIAGILGNAMQESTCNPVCPAGKRAGGLFGFDPFTGFTNSTENSNCQHEKSNGGCADGSCQIAYMLRTFKERDKKYWDYLDKYNTFVAQNANSDYTYNGITMADVPKTVPSGDFSAFQAAETPDGAANVFQIVFEVNAATQTFASDRGLATKYDGRDAGAKAYGSMVNFGDFFLTEFCSTEGKVKANRGIFAKKFYTWLGGADLSDGAKTAKTVSKQLKKSGYWSESQLSAFNKLIEPALTDQTSNSKRDNLSSDTMNGLSDWEMNVASTREDAGIIAWVRRIIALTGIFIIIWSILLYISYWFDLINPFFDFDLMSKITFGKLCVSHELDGSCTWRLELNPKDRSKKTINHRGVLFLTFFGLVFGVLVVSGLLYSWLLWVVNWANSVIKDLL